MPFNNAPKVELPAEMQMYGKRLQRSFFVRHTLTVARGLLGKILIRKIGNGKLAGRIVETEAYIGPKDKASHSYNGKITPRNKTEYLEGGHIYIYLCYGMYWQLNITTTGEGEPECVLIRAVEPVDATGLSLVNITNGPGKLCRWLKLDKSFNEEDLSESKRIWLESGRDTIEKSQIVATKRIGIDYAGSWAQKPWRFYIANNPYVSKK